MEEQTKGVERSELWWHIFEIVKQIPRKSVDGDAMDAHSASTDIELMLQKRSQGMINEEVNAEELAHNYAEILTPDLSRQSDLYCGFMEGYKIKTERQDKVYSLKHIKICILLARQSVFDLYENNIQKICSDVEKDIIQSLSKLIF